MHKTINGIVNSIENYLKFLLWKPIKTKHKLFI